MSATNRKQTQLYSTRARVSCTLLPFLVLLLLMILVVSSVQIAVAADENPILEEGRVIDEEIECPLELTPGLDFHPAHAPEGTYQLNGETTYKGEVWFRCMVGYRMVGCSKAMCTPQGWRCEDPSLAQNPLPKCVQSSTRCPPLPEFVRGGSWRLASAHQLDHFEQGDVATLTCSSRFSISTNSLNSVSCVLNEASGKLEWSIQPLPTCTPNICSDLIPASLSPGLVMRTMKGNVITPVSGSSTLEVDAFHYQCAVPSSSPSRSVTPSSPSPQSSSVRLQNLPPSQNKPNILQQRYSTSARGGQYGNNKFYFDPAPDDFNYTFVIQRLCPDVTELRLIGVPLHRIQCSKQGKWVKEGSDISIELQDDEFGHAENDEMKLKTPLTTDAQLPLTKRLSYCNHLVQYDETLDEYFSEDFCPPLPFFSDTSIPGWIDTKREHPSNAMPLHFSAALDCGKESWPESAATNADHTLRPTAHCVPYHRSKPVKEEDDDDVDDNDGSNSRNPVIGRWRFRHGDGSDWTGSIPPTCVPKPKCEGLPTYSGWRLASSLPPHKFYANDEATCTSTLTTSNAKTQVRCIADGSTTARLEPQLDASELACQEVTCPNPGGYPLAFRSSQEHNNFIGHIDHDSIVDEDVRVDYFAVDDILHYSCYYHGRGFQLQCSSTGEWIMEGNPCQSY